MKVRGRRLSWPWAAVVAVAALMIGAPAESALTAACTDAQLVPRAELSVSQGAPGYARLARGKETIVRAYLTNPSTCTPSNKQSIAPVSATLDVANGDAPPPAQLSNYAPLAGKLGAAQQIAPTSDPFFVVPASYLAPTNTNSFNISFTLNITYTRNGLATRFTSNSAATMSKPVDQRTNALRILVVPMGDPTSASTQWSASAETALQNVMTNAARAFPVPSGATPQLTPTTTGGIRYVVSTALLDVKSLGMYNGAKFCANGTNWNTSQVSTGSYAGHTLKADLLQRFADYNLLNNPPADMVMGVIDGAIAWKSAGDPVTGCDDGRAATPASRASGQVGWVRISTDAYPTPLQMELMHPFGISDASLSFHSPNPEADGAAPGKGYNVVQRKVVDLAAGALGVNDHSIMNYNTTSIPYTKDNTLLEPNDWGDALCDLGGVDSVTNPVFANCTLNTGLGSSQGVAGGGTAMYQISGILTSSGIRVTDAKVASGDANAPVGVASGLGPHPLHLLFYSGACPGTPSVPAGDVALATFGGEGHHGPSEGLGEEPGDSFGALVPLPPGATRAELQLSGVSKFNASACDTAPDIVSTSTVAQGSTAPGTIVRSFPGPACCNGRAVAFDGTNLFTTVANPSGETSTNKKIYKISTTGAPIGTPIGTGGNVIGALAFNSTTQHLYAGDYTRSDGSPNGTGKVFEIDPSTSEPTPTELFVFNDPSCTLGPSIDGLEYLPGGTPLFAISGDICDTVFFKKLNGGTPSSSECPVVGAEVETCQFATENNSGITTDGAGGLWLARLQTEGGPPGGTLLTRVNLQGSVLDELVISGYQAEDLAYDSVTFASTSTCVVWMSEATAGTPDIQAVAVPCGAASGPKGAVGVQTTNTRFVSVQFTCGDPGTLNDERPTFTLANGLVPGTEGSVIAPFSSQLFCGESPGKIISTASNGWNWTGLTDPEATETATGTATDPTVNIASPLNGSKYRRGEFVHYEGSAFDAFNGAIITGLKWYFDDTVIDEGTDKMSFDKKLAATAPLGNHTIKLVATDADGHVGSASVTIIIGPALCPSTSSCP
jgi:hypothetical protein